MDNPFFKFLNKYWDDVCAAIDSFIKMLKTMFGSSAK